MAPQKQHGKPNYGDRPSFNSSAFRSEWIKSEFTPETIQFAEEFGEYLANNRLTTSQIRNIYGEVMRIVTQVSSEGSLTLQARKEFLLLKPKIAYAAKRSGTRGIRAFKEVLDMAHQAVLDADDKVLGIENFKDFFEAILAYHKASGGRE